MLTDILEELSILTTIEKKYLIKLKEKLEWCLCDAINESQLKGESISRLDIGLGTLNIDIGTEGQIRYKFIPSEEFEKAVSKTVVEKSNPLVDKAEKYLVNHIIKVYQDMF